MKDSLSARLTWHPMKNSLKGSFGEGPYKYQKDIGFIDSVQQKKYEKEIGFIESVKKSIKKRLVL